MQSIQAEKLKKEADALILAHYYVPGEVQDMADYVGDSYALAVKAAHSDKKVIVFCGVSFMGESAKVLSPDKTVYLPERNAHCAMAEMADVREAERMKREIPDLAVVTYINSGAALKAVSDVIVTSSNALKIVSALPQKNVYFIPDRNLGRYVAEHDASGKKFYFCEGHCPIHARTTKEDVLAAKAAHPEALFLVHPECPAEVCALADCVGSTAEIIAFAQGSRKKHFIIGTEEGVLHALKKSCPDKQFYPLREGMICEDMKKITPEKVLAALRGEVPPVEVDERTREGAERALKKMLELAK